MQIYQETGLHFGFPECCITSFREGIFKQHKPLYKEFMQATGVKNKGFIPCLNHLKQLAEKQTDISELLKNRKCTTSFPDGHLCACPRKIDKLNKLKQK
jgi:hypothetical protein